MIRWLHISDLHLGSTDLSTDRLRDELLSFLQKEGIRCDYVFCTGDIRTASKGDHPFTDDMAKYLHLLCESTNTPIENLFIVPGNHDIDRDAPDRKAAIERVKFKWQGYYEPAKGVIRQEDMAAIMEGEKDFVNFLSKVYPADRLSMYGNPNRPHFNIETCDFNVLHVDSTVSYTEGQEATDLIIGTHLLYKEIQGLNKMKPTIILTHYPFTSLLQDEKKQLAILLQKNGIKLWLAGHEHDHVLQPIRYLDSLQAGELRYENNANASFVIGEYDQNLGRGHAKVFAWFPEGWAPYPFVDLTNRHVDRYEFTLTTVQNGGLSRETLAAKSANEQFYHRLPPKIELNLLPAIDDNGNITSLERLLNETWDSNTPHVIMLADGGMGKTTMLLDYCQKSTDPILYIPAERLVALGIGIEQYCVGNIYDNDADALRESLYTRYSKPTLTLFIDGLNEVDGKSEKAFVLEIQRLNMLKGLRIVVTSRSNFTLRYSMPGYRSTRLIPLDDGQVSGFFNEIEWARIKGTRALHQLLGNPMMVTVYKEICSVIDEFKDVEFLDWILPVKNSTDLFHDYYVAQVALMMKRGELDGKKILLAAMCISDVLPAIAYEYECRRRLNLNLEEFRELLDGILQKTVIVQKNLLPIQEHYREEEIPSLDVMHVSDFLTQNLRLLHRDKAITAFPHQIYRDYLSAQWIIRQSQVKEKVLEMWNSRKIPYPVMTHIRCGSGAYWKNGIASKVHQAGIGVTGDSAYLLVGNLLNCFPGTGESGTPDYSGLWLRGHRLPDNPVGEKKIDLSGAEIDRTTVGLSSDDLTLYTNLCFSDNRKFLAAIAVKDNERRIQLNIFSIENGSLVYNHELNKKVGNVMFCGNWLFVVSGNIFLFTQDADCIWHYTGEIGEADKNVLKKLQKAVIADHILYLYYFSRLVTYDLQDCHRIGISNGKHWEKPVEGAEVTSLRRTIPWAINNSRQTDILSKVGDDSLCARSYGDGELLVECEGETQLELAKGATLLLDATISGDGKSAATLGFQAFGDRRNIQLWDLDNERRVADLTCPSMIKNLHLSETGKWLMGETNDKTWVLNSESGQDTWYEEHFVSNHTGRLITYGDKVIRKKDRELFLFDLQTGEEELLKSPVPNPRIVCFLSDRTLAAVDERGRTLHLWSTRDGRLLSQHMDGFEILSIQPIQSKPFIAVFTSDNKIRIYHTGVRRDRDQMQCLIKEAGETTAKQMVAHQVIPLMANTDGRRHLETRFFEERTVYGKEIGHWKRHLFPSGRLVIDGDILDIAFNVQNHQLVAILANGKIMYCNDKNCTYRDSFKIITAFNVNAYDFSGCNCPEDLRTSLRRNGA